MFLGGLIGIGEFVQETETTGLFWWKKTVYRSLSERMPSLILAIGLILIAVVCLCVALRITLMIGRHKRYLAIIKGNDRLLIQRIASITNTNIKRVMNDLQNMIDLGYIEDYYIDYEQGLLIDKSYVPNKIVKKIVKCPECGANNEVIVGQSNYCVSCRGLLLF